MKRGRNSAYRLEFNIKNCQATNNHNRKLPYGEVTNMSFLEAENHCDVLSIRKNPLSMFLSIFPPIGGETSPPILRRGAGLIADEGYKSGWRARAQLPHPHRGPRLLVQDADGSITSLLWKQWWGAQAPQVKGQKNTISYQSLQPAPISN